MSAFVGGALALAVYMLAGFGIAWLYRSTLDLSVDGSLTVAYAGLILGVLIQNRVNDR